MDLGKTKRLLQKEFTRSPGKTLTLIGLLPLAGYFILPLLMGKKDTATVSVEPRDASTFVAPAANALVALPAANASNGSHPGAPHVDWEKIVQWIEMDPLRKSGEVSRSRDPFAFGMPPVDDIVGVQEVGNENENLPDAKVEPDVEVIGEFEPSGLALTGTIVGPNIRVATINGETYREFGIITVEVGENEVHWRVSQIAEDYVVLLGHGKEFLLRLKPMEIEQHGISIVRHRR